MSDGTTPEDAQDFKIISSPRKTRDIYGAEGMTHRLLRKSTADGQPVVPPDQQQKTNQGVAFGMRAHLIDKHVARELRDANTTHGACIDAKASATVGLGHRDEKIHEVLDPLCQFSWQDTLDAMADDFWETGECFLEACFNDPANPRRVTGLFHVESTQIHVEVEMEDNSELYHYIVDGETNSGQTTVMAKWGDLEELKKRFGVQPDGTRDPNNTNANDAVRSRISSPSGTIKNSEIIHVRQSRNRSRWYGFPDYMAAVPSIELVQCMTQHEFDFYFNRAVPEFLAFLIGPNASTKTWEKFEKMLTSNQGLGNSHKTCAVHIPGDSKEVSVQIEKLAMDDNGKDGFTDKSMTLAMLITTAHGVPPMLANVALPAKIGAVNEGPNALMLIQKRKIGPAQRNFSTVFARTLGAEETEFGQPDGTTAKLRADQFLGKSSVEKAPKPIAAAPGAGAPPAPDAKSPAAPKTPMVTVKIPMHGGQPPTSPIAKAALGPATSQNVGGPVPPQADPNAPPPGSGATDENGQPIHVTPGNGFKTILDGITPAAANTMASMRQPLTGSGRDLNAGLLGSAHDRPAGDPNAQ